MWRAGQTCPLKAPSTDNDIVRTTTASSQDVPNVPHAVSERVQLGSSRQPKAAGSTGFANGKPRRVLQTLQHDCVIKREQDSKSQVGIELAFGQASARALPGLTELWLKPSAPQRHQLLAERTRQISSVWSTSRYIVPI